MVFTLLERKGTEWHRLPSLAVHSTPQPGAHRCEYTFLERSTWTRLAQHPWTSAPKSCGIASRRTQTEHNPKTGQKEKSGDEPPRRQPAPSFPMKPQHGIGTHGVQGTVSGSQAEVCERAAPAQEALQALEKRWSASHPGPRFPPQQPQHRWTRCPRCLLAPGGTSHPMLTLVSSTARLPGFPERSRCRREELIASLAASAWHSALIPVWVEGEMGLGSRTSHPSSSHPHRGLHSPSRSSAWPYL